MRLANLGLIDGFRAELVVAGIHHGVNLGDDITYSGTVAAALESELISAALADRPSTTTTRNALPSCAAQLSDVETQAEQQMTRQRYIACVKLCLAAAQQHMQGTLASAAALKSRYMPHSASRSLPRGGCAAAVTLHAQCRLPCVPDAHLLGGKQDGEHNG